MMRARGIFDRECYLSSIRVSFGLVGRSWIMSANAPYPLGMLSTKFLATVSSVWMYALQKEVGWLAFRTTSMTVTCRWEHWCNSSQRSLLTSIIFASCFCSRYRGRSITSRHPTPSTLLFSNRFDRTTWLVPVYRHTQDYKWKSVSVKAGQTMADVEEPFILVILIFASLCFLSCWRIESFLFTKAEHFRH